MNYFALRRQALIETFRSKSARLDAFLIAGGVNVSYLTGADPDVGYLIVTAKNTILVSDSRFEQQIHEQCPEFGNTAGLEVHIRPHNRTTIEAVAEILTRLKVKQVGVEANRISLGEFECFQEMLPKIVYVPQSGVVETLRSVKDDSEIEQIREAIRIAERAFRMFIATIGDTDSEKVMVDAMEGFIRRAGGKTASFPPIIGVAERAALPHALPTEKQLSQGNLLLVDWGADIGYKSDITRTFQRASQGVSRRGKKSAKKEYHFAEIYEIVLAAQRAAIAAIRPGVRGVDVDAAARNLIAERGYGDYFTHGLGHGIGLEIHEAPRVRQNSTDVLLAGMVITIEPGIYIPEWGGIRIEDDILVTPDGSTVLTTLANDLSSTVLNR